MSDISTSRRLLHSKTYIRSSQKFVDSSKAFDAAVKIESSKFNIKAVPTIAKWGKFTFTSSKPVDVEKVETRKRKLDEPEDPFSFEPTRKCPNPSRMISLHKKAKYKYRMWNDVEESKQVNDDCDSCESSNLHHMAGLEVPEKLLPNPRQVFESLPKLDELFLDQVVKDVKQAHECQESGETQEFTDDIEYIMDGLGKNQKPAIRCLSALSLLSKCTSSVFRMHLRAHGILSRIFGALADSPESPALALCAACLFMLISRDRLSVDLEKSSYQLMLKLLSVDDVSKNSTNNSAPSKRYLTSSSATFFKSRHILKHLSVDKEYQNVQLKVYNLCTKPQHLDKPILPDLTLSSTSTSNLAMEALLKFSSRKDVDFFKEDLREFGGLDRIIDAACSHIEELPENDVTSNKSCVRLLQSIEMFLQVFENVTCLNPSNQNHLLMYQSAVITSNLNRCLKLCCLLIPTSDFEEVNGKLNRNCSGNTVYNCLLSVLNVFINLTNDNAIGCSKVGSVPGLIATLLDCLFNVSTLIPSSCQFDLTVLCLGLLINLIENCRSNLRTFIQVGVKSKGSSLKALGELFTLYYDAAKTFEEEHDAELESAESSQNLNCNVSLVGECSGEWVETDIGVEWVSHQNSQSQGDFSQEKQNRSNSMLTQDSDHFNRALLRAGRHMEDSIVAAYIALLIGCFIKHDSNLVGEIRYTLPDYSFFTLSRMLKKFHNFMNITQGMRASCSKSILQIVGVLESC